MNRVCFVDDSNTALPAMIIPISEKEIRLLHGNKQTTGLIVGINSKNSNNDSNSTFSLVFFGVTVAQLVVGMTISLLSHCEV